MNPAYADGGDAMQRLPRASGDGPVEMPAHRVARLPRASGDGAVSRQVCGAEASAAVSTDDIFAPIAPTRISTPARDVDPGAENPPRARV